MIGVACICRESGARATYGVVGFNERIVDGDDVDIIVLDGIAEDDTTNAAESVDANLGGSHDDSAEIDVRRWFDGECFDGAIAGELNQQLLEGLID